MFCKLKRLFTAEKCYFYFVNFCFVLENLLKKHCYKKQFCYFLVHLSILWWVIVISLCQVVKEFYKNDNE